MLEPESPSCKRMHACAQTCMAVTVTDKWLTIACAATNPLPPSISFCNSIALYLSRCIAVIAIVVVVIAVVIVVIVVVVVVVVVVVG